MGAVGGLSSGRRVMLVLVILGLIVTYVLVRVGWLYLRRAISRFCARARCEEIPRALRGWVTRQAAWSFDEAWKKLWT